jgi:tRNA A37 N6-isopentenylltransferase MiaA
MDDKYQISKPKKPETKQEIIQTQIEELVKRRDQETDPAAKQKLNAEITKLFAQYERLKL